MKDSFIMAFSEFHRNHESKSHTLDTPDSLIFSLFVESGESHRALPLALRAQTDLGFFRSISL